MSLVKHAERELELAGYLDKDGDRMYGDMAGKAVLSLIHVFAKQGHSGMSADVVRGIFNKLANREVLTDLTFAADEWIDINEKYGEASDNEPRWQNKRCSTVFKDDDGSIHCNERGKWDPKTKTWEKEKPS